MNDSVVKLFWSAGSLALLLVILVTSAMAAPQQVVIYKDESKAVTLKQPFIEYALGNDEIAGVVVRKNDSESTQVVINGKAEGTTNLIFWGAGGQVSANFDIVVKGRDLGQMLKDVRIMLGNIKGITAEIVGEKIIVKGQAITPQDMKTVTQLLQENEFVINTVTLSASALKVITDIINEFAGGQGQVTVKPVGQALVLNGISYGKGSGKRVEEFAKIFHHTVVNLIKEKDVGLDPGKDKMIQVHAHFMEMKKKAIQGNGASWTPLGALDVDGTRTGAKSSGIGGGSVKQNMWTISGFFSNLLPHFHTDKETSFGRQLQVSSISVRSGEKGNFQSGGEIGYPVTSGLGQATIVFKKYGMHLEVLPISQGNQITLRIKIKVNIPISLTAGGYLNFTNSEVETVQYCKAGDSIAISGILGNVDRKVFDVNPETSGALFELFSSENFQREETELVIFITPEILLKAADANMELRQKIMEEFESYDPVSR